MILSEIRRTINEQNEPLTWTKRLRERSKKILELKMHELT